MGQRDLKCLMITGAMAVVNWAVRRDETTDPWLDREARGCAIRRSWTRRPIRRHAARRALWSRRCNIGGARRSPMAFSRDERAHSGAKRGAGPKSRGHYRAAQRRSLFRPPESLVVAREPQLMAEDGGPAAQHRGACAAPGGWVIAGPGRGVMPAARGVGPGGCAGA